MKRKTNVINSILPIVLTAAALFVVVYINSKRDVMTMGEAMIRFMVGAIIAGFFHALFHELGHLIAGKNNSFAFSEMVVWFFRWQKVGSHTEFSLVMLGDEAGYTQMIPTNADEVENGLKNMTFGGLFASFVLMLLGLIPFFVLSINGWVYCILSMFLPLGVYYFLGNALPKEQGGVYNDGAVLLGIKKQDDITKVTVNLLKIQAMLYNGKTPSQIDESLYFDLPQIAEDKLPFAMLLSARYAYYLDKEDYGNAKKVTARLLSIEDYLSKGNLLLVKTDALYNSCTFDYNEDIADDLTYELEAFLNNVNTATNVRAKLAYLVYIVKQTDGADKFIEKGIKEAKKHQIKGLGIMEEKLIRKIEKDFLSQSEN